MTDEQLQQIEELSAALLTPGEIAILVGIQAEERKAFALRCRSHQGSPEYESFYRGRLTTKLQLRQNIIKLAKAGSPAAEPLAEKFLQEQNIDK